MPSPRKGSLRWVERKMHELAEQVALGKLTASEAKAMRDLYKTGLEARISRSKMNRDGDDIETYLEDDSGSPTLEVIEGRRAS